MQSGIMGAKMFDKPLLQAVCALFLAEVFPFFIIVHDVTDFIEQTLMIGLVFGIVIIVVLAHDFFLQGEMHGYPRKDFSEKILYRVFGAGPDHPVVRLVDQLEELPVFVIHGRNAD